MASVTISNGTAIVLADETDYNPANSLGARTNQLDLTSLANGAYRQSAKIDFGASRAEWWEATGMIEPDVAPTAQSPIELWIGWSASATAGTGNPGNLSGSDAEYVGYGAAATDADECINQLDYIGHIPMSADLAIQTGHFGFFRPKQRYGIIVVRNGCGQALESDAVEMAVRLSPLSVSIA